MLSGQNGIASIAGNNSAKNVDKIAALKEMGFKFYSGKKIKALMVEGSSLNAECRLMKQIPLGDHTAFVGEVLEASSSGKKPLVYHAQQFWKLGESMQKPPKNELDRITKIIGKYSKK